MIIRSKDLLNLPVETKGGQALGNISNLEIEIDSQKIIRYHIKSRTSLSGLLGKELIIHCEQVISITLEKMTVEDNVSKVAKKVATVPT